MFDTLIKDITLKLPSLILLQDEPLSRHCSFRIGGPVSVLAQPKTEEELLALCGILKSAGVQPLIMGNGTNILFTDSKLDRFIIQCCTGMNHIEKNDNTITAACGVTLAQLANFALNESLGGLEFAAGIPGSVGGAVSMNAGAYGGEIKDVVVKSRYLDSDLNIREQTGNAQNFSYRHSFYSDKDYIILDADFVLQEQDKTIIAEKMQELSIKRRTSQPLDLPSAGSTFKRPAKGYAAAMIDDAGLRGYRVGGAQVSEKHTGFVVNTGSATYDDVRKLMAHIQKTVFDYAGIVLEPEVKIIES